MAKRLLIAAVAGAAACGPSGAPERNAQENDVIETVDVPQTVNVVAPGTTPMAQRVAVLRLINKRNGQWRELSLRPGQAVRAGDVIVRLRACETTAPWEVQTLTGAFVQLDVRNAQDRLERVFSGWLYKESPSLNVVEHPIYDIWPMSCTMTHPEGGEPVGRDSSSRSRAPNSAGSAPAESTEPADARDEASAAPTPSAEANNVR